MFLHEIRDTNNEDKISSIEMINLHIGCRFLNCDNDIT